MFATEVSSLIKGILGGVLFFPTRNGRWMHRCLLRLVGAHTTPFFNLLELLCQVESDSLIET